MENKEGSAFGQVVGPLNGTHHYNLRCLACQRLSRTSLPERLLDYPMVAETPATRTVSVSEPKFFCEHCGAAGVETHHWAPQNLIRDYNTWPTAPLCATCPALWQDVMRAGVARP
ncbi:MAG TPA: hypothetical protein VFE60_16235 [Roseiarcus sp.]|nr:hypothetical protein [Roseiarcus sp.]